MTNNGPIFPGNPYTAPIPPDDDDDEPEPLDRTPTPFERKMDVASQVIVLCMIVLVTLIAWLTS